MAVTNYYSVDSDILGEKTTASSRIDYLTDALGSVTATLNQSAQVVNTYRYKPYGAQLAKTGTAADPAFTWVGAQGYRQTGRKYSEIYIQSGYYSVIIGMWTTQATFPLIKQTSHNIDVNNMSTQMRLSELPACVIETNSSPYALMMSNPVKAASGIGRISSGNSQNDCHRIGPVPPDWKCGDPRMGDNDAVTSCDLNSGRVWTINCNYTCVSPCIDAHEGQHRHDQAECCKRGAKCVKRYGLEICGAAYGGWFKGNRAWRECRGFKAGITCEEQMIRANDCWHCKTGSRCCDDLIGTWESDQNEMKGWCKGINPWGPPPMKCPFKADGSIA